MSQLTNCDSGSAIVILGRTIDVESAGNFETIFLVHCDGKGAAFRNEPPNLGYVLFATSLFALSVPLAT
jgi:hypothetical protein